MTAYLLRRLLHAASVLVGVNLLTFALFFVVASPDDMARVNLGGKRVAQLQIDHWKAARGYDKPLWWNAAAQGQQQWRDTVFWDRSVSLLWLDFGRSDAQEADDIGHEIRQRMGVSLQLAVPLFGLQIAASLSIALLLLLVRGTALEPWGVLGCVLAMSVSALFYVAVGQALVSRVLKLAPMSGYEPGPQALRFLVLPVLLALLSRLGAQARLYRAMLLEELGRDHVRTARAKGLGEGRVLVHHVLRNALVPILTSAGSDLPFVFLGSLVFETFFGIPGLGAYVVDAVTGQDFAIVRSMVFVGSVVYILSFLVIDLACAAVDPRVRLQ